jgi:hypothetical protein
MSPPLLLLWRLPEGLVRRESIRRQKIRGGASSSRGDSTERGRRAEVGGGMESGNRTEGAPGSREGGTGSSGGGRAVAIAPNRAFGPQTHHPSSCQYCTYSIRFVDSVKGEKEGDRRGSLCISVCPVLQFLFIADFLWGLRFPSCDSCTIAGVPRLTEIWKKNGT